MPNLLIAVPTMGSIHNLLVQNLIHWGRETKHYNPNFYFTNRTSPTDRARNEIVEFFLSQPQLTHLMMIDSDTIPPIDAPQRLLAHDVHFVSAMTPIMSRNKETGEYEFFDNCFLFPTEDDDGQRFTNIAGRNQGLQLIYRCGAACMVISRDVFEYLQPPYFKFEYNDSYTQHTRSEDIYFVDQLRNAAVSVFADTDVICQHEKSVML